MSYTCYRRPCETHPKSSIRLPSGLYQCLRCVIPTEPVQSQEATIAGTRMPTEQEIQEIMDRTRRRLDEQRLQNDRPRFWGEAATVGNTVPIPAEERDPRDDIEFYNDEPPGR